MEVLHKKPRHRIGTWIIAVMACLLTVFTPAPGKADQPVVKNVIVLMADGCGINHTTIARWYKGASLAIDNAACGLVRTYSADSIITDSAPAATAFATGHKTDDKFIGVLPNRTIIPGVKPTAEDRRFKPVATVLEGAKYIGKATGLVVTSNVQHASPAGYSAHWPDRSNFHEIAVQQVHQNIDVVFGGGARYLLPKEKGGSREDEEDLLDILKSRGYAIVYTREAMIACRENKVWGLFAQDAMSYEADRPLVAPTEPSLAEMTSKAIEILSRKEKGFFLFVEGSKIDWASHANDPVGVISDLLAFDDAARIALEFAKKDGNTLVLIFSDHDNGGLSIGSTQSDKTYASTSYEALVTPLKRARLTGEGVEKMLRGDRSETAIRQMVEQYYAISDLSDEDVNKIKETRKGHMNSALGPILSARSVIGWTTHGHNGADVPLYAFGPGRPSGVIDNTELASIMAAAMGFDLNRMDARLFVEARSLLKDIGAEIRIDQHRMGHPVLMVEKEGKTASMPLGRNILKTDQAVFELKSLFIFAPGTDRAYIPAQTIDLLKAAGF
ncbi:MAG: alkaline phosphatase [Syntrophus sp. SKADARSKE-3]|nr:alkaline phosphatase [Syntrophus sp. SKADARSKE-3]